MAADHDSDGRDGDDEEEEDEEDDDDAVKLQLQALPQLRAICRQLGLPTTGRKAEMLRRLAAHRRSCRVRDTRATQSSQGLCDGDGAPSPERSEGASATGGRWSLRSHNAEEPVQQLQSEPQVERAAAGRRVRGRRGRAATQSALVLRET